MTHNLSHPTAEPKHRVLCSHCRIHAQTDECFEDWTAPPSAPCELCGSTTPPLYAFAPKEPPNGAL